MSDQNLYYQKTIKVAPPAHRASGSVVEISISEGAEENPRTVLLMVTDSPGVLGVRLTLEQAWQLSAHINAAADHAQSKQNPTIKTKDQP